MKVPFFDMRAELAPLRAEIDDAIAHVLDSGVLIGGPEVAAFEAELAARVGCARAVVPVHLFGLPAAIPAGAVPVIEDAAQSIGAAPVVGRAAALSFFPTK